MFLDGCQWMNEGSIPPSSISLSLSACLPPSVYITRPTLPCSLKVPDEWWTQSWKYPGSSALVSLLLKVCHCVGRCSVLQCEGSACVHYVKSRLIYDFYTLKSIQILAPKILIHVYPYSTIKVVLVFLRRDCLLFIHTNIHWAMKVLLPVSCQLPITTIF